MLKNPYNIVWNIIVTHSTSLRHTRLHRYSRPAMTANMSQQLDHPHLHEEPRNSDEEKRAFLLPIVEHEEPEKVPVVAAPGLNRKFWFSTAVNTICTALIVSSKAHVSGLFEAKTPDQGLHQQANLRRCFPPPRPSRIRCLPFRRHGAPTLHHLSATDQHLSGEESRPNARASARVSHDPERRSSKRIVGQFERAILPSR